MSQVPYIPPDLPPKLDLGKHVSLIGTANRALGELNGSLQHPAINPHLLISPLLTREAVSSSKIEGTQATLEDVFQAEAAGENIEEFDQLSGDVREIVNYRDAMLKSVEMLTSKPLGENIIKDAHRILLNSVRGTNKNPGEFRTQIVHIGKPGSTLEQALYIPPPPSEIAGLFSNWEKYINSPDAPDPLIQIAVAHYQFEAIHPFKDGNGRIGRMLIPLFLVSRGLLDYPVLYISEYFEKYRDEYENALRIVDKTGDWNTWIDVFLHAVAIQSLNTQTKILKIGALYTQMRNKLDSIKSPYAGSILDAFFLSPVMTVAKLRSRVSVKSDQTIYNLLRKFAAADIIHAQPDKIRNRSFGIPALISLLRSDGDE